MKKRTIYSIVSITSIALIGLIATQLFWIDNAKHIAQKHYEHRVTIAINNAISDLLEHSRTHSQERVDQSILPFSSQNESIYPIDTLALDSLLHVHFAYQNLGEIYAYSIVETNTESVLYTKGTSSQAHSCQKGCLSKLWKSNEYQLKVSYSLDKQFSTIQMYSWITVSILFILIVVICFGYIIYAIVQQKKLSELKNDFINNMTHEFKTPISTIGLSADMLSRLQCKCNEQRVQRYIQIIRNENNRLKNLANKILQLSIIDKGQFLLDLKQTDLHELAKTVSQSICSDKNTKQISIEFDFKADNHTLQLDQEHIGNVIKNLLNNACQYSTEKSTVTISTINNPEGLVFSVEDRGAGMSLATQKGLFEKFHRPYTGNVHDVKGVGLGLYYVKAMVEAHNGEIKVKSTPDKGSRFDIFLPF